jgi:hypothetical protein
MIDLRAEMEAAAEHLTGDVILLRFRQPPTRGAQGECYKVEDGLVCIDIFPALGIAKTYELFLHETAHAKLHVKHVIETPDHLTYSGAIAETIPPAAIQSILKEREAQAEAQAARWDVWAEKFVEGETITEARTVGKIAALRYYKE